MGVRDRNRGELAQPFDVLNRSVVQQADIVPKQVPVSTSNRKCALTDAELRLYRRRRQLRLFFGDLRALLPP